VLLGLAAAALVGCLGWPAAVALLPWLPRRPGLYWQTNRWRSQLPLGSAGAVAW